MLIDGWQRMFVAYIFVFGEIVMAMAKYQVIPLTELIDKSEQHNGEGIKERKLWIHCGKKA